MSDTVASLIGDLLAWLARSPRPYHEVMEAWRTSCPRLPVWEDATDRGLVAMDRVGTDIIVRITPAGHVFLAERAGQEPGRG
jgi:hypothetical protein